MLNQEMEWVKKIARQIAKEEIALAVAGYNEPVVEVADPEEDDAKEEIALASDNAPKKEAKK